MKNHSAFVGRGKKLQTAAADLFLAGLLIYLYFFASTQYSLFDTRLLVISGVVVAGLVVTWLVVGRNFIPQELILPLGVFLAVQGLAAALSIDPRRSVIEVWLLVVEASLFLIFAGLAGRIYTPQRVVRAALFAGALFMALSWSEALQWYLKWLQAHPGQWLPTESYRLPAPNFLCTILNVWLFFVLARLWWTRGSLQKAALGLFALSALGLIYMTSSRGGWIGTIAGFGCLLLVSLRLDPAFWKTRWEKVRHSRLAMIGLASGVIVLVVGFIVFLLLQENRPGHSPFLLARGYLWQPAWNAFLRSPMWGSGPFTFISFYLQVNSVPPNLYFDYAHNIYLDLLSGSGLLGLASFAWLTWIVLRKFIRGLGEKKAEDLALLTGAIAACAAFLVHGMFDSVHHTVPTSAWNLAVLLGATSAFGFKKGAHSPHWKVIAVCGLGLLAVAGFFINAWLNVGMAKGVQAGQSGDWNLAAQEFELAAQRDPYLAVTHQQLGLAYSQLYLQGNESMLIKAEAAFERAAKLDPYWMVNDINLGLAREALGDLPGALQAYRQAVAAAPQAYETHSRLGQALEASGDIQAARQNYESALKTCPDCLCYAFWQETALRREYSAGVDCPEMGPGIAWNPGYVAYMFRRPSLNFDWAPLGELNKDSDK